MKDNLRGVPSNARSLSVSEVNYYWLPGGPGVVVWDAEGKKHLAPIEQVTGLTPEAFERGQRNRTSDGMITPFDVANWIRVHLQGRLAVSR